MANSLKDWRVSDQRTNTDLNRSMAISAISNRIENAYYRGSSADGVRGPRRSPIKGTMTCLSQLRQYRIFNMRLWKLERMSALLIGSETANLSMRRGCRSGGIRPTNAADRAA